jgi:molybdopterin converting factor small subunit
MTIRVKVYAPAFVDHNRIDEDNYILLKDGASVHSLFNSLKVPLLYRPFMVCSVNYDQAGPSTRLKDGDTVSFIVPITGG